MGGFGNRVLQDEANSIGSARLKVAAGDGSSSSFRSIVQSDYPTVASTCIRSIVQKIVVIWQAVAL